MNIALAIIGTLIVEWGFIAFFNRKQLKIDKAFQLELEKILQNKKSPRGIRKDNALWLCRNTEGELAAGAYMALNKFDLE